MKSMFFWIVLLCSSGASAGEKLAASYSDGKETCLEFEKDRFAFRMIVGEGVHEVLGNGAYVMAPERIILKFTDSFGDDVAGYFDWKTGKLSLSGTRAEGSAISLAAGSYADFQLHAEKCESNAF